MKKHLLSIDKFHEKKTVSTSSFLIEQFQTLLKSLPKQESSICITSAPHKALTKAFSLIRPHPTVRLTISQHFLQ